MLKQKTFLFLPSRQIFVLGGSPEGSSFERQETPQVAPEEAHDVIVDPRKINEVGKDEAESAIRLQMSALDNLQTADTLSNNVNVKYKAEKFTDEELKRKTKGYPELKQIPKKPVNIQELIKEGKFENLTHGDTRSFTIDFEDGKGEKEYIVLMDESGKKPKLRLFKES